MDASAVISAVWGAAFLLLIVIVCLSRRARRHGGALRGGVAGAMYEWQNREKQKALEMIVEGKAEGRRPEYADGNLPELESPKEPRRGRE
jgi:hypothetical protein